MKKYILPILAIAGLTLSIFTVVRPGHPACGRDGRSSAFDTSESPRDNRRGLIEAKRENIPLGTVVAGVVTEVYVKRGDIVKKDSPCSASSPARIQSESIFAFSRFFYSLPEQTAIPLHVGQQMDVYIEAAKPPEGIQLEIDPMSVTKPFEDESRTAGGKAKPSSP